MIYGKTHKQRSALRRKRWAKKEAWRRWFAWYPVEIEDGRDVWLCFVEKRDVKGYYFYDWYPEYRLIKRSK